MKRYVIDGISLPIERNRRKDYQIFKENNKREEQQFGKLIDNGTWEYLPHGQFIMMYSEKKDVYVPARITELKKNKELRLTILDINTMKFVTIIYEKKQRFLNEIFTNRYLTPNIKLYNCDSIDLGKCIVTSI